MSPLSLVGPTRIKRCLGGVARRARYWWQTATRGRCPPLAESALEWLLQHAAADGLSPTFGGAVCPGLTAATIPTLCGLGVDGVALRWARRLLRLQRPDGALPDAGLLHPSLFNTAQAARAFAELESIGALPEAASARRRACGFLVSRIAADGTIRVAEAGGSFERWAPPPVRLAGLAAVVEAADPSQRAARAAAVRRAVELMLRTADVAESAASLHIVLHGIEALLDLEAIEPRAGVAARWFLLRAVGRQRGDGAVAADVEHRWVSSAGLAHLAALWYRTGMPDAADRALACMAARQRRDGAWTGSWGRGAAYFPRSPSTWTAKYVLDASAAQVRAAFVGDAPDPAEPLADDDGRLRAVVELVAQLPADSKLLDAGCGTGRYLARLAEQFPRLKTTGVDPSPTLLKDVPPSSRTALGNLLRLPAADASYDAAICIEALEHSLLPERAVAELCRVVRPGGRVLIVDKHQRCQPLSLCEPWERWFEPETVSGWLARHCSDVTCAPLPPGPHQRTPGLFWRWEATRRAASPAAVAPPTPARRAA